MKERRERTKEEVPEQAISRIPSWTVISLGRRSPSASSGVPGDGAGHAIVPLHRLAPGRACLVSPACAVRHCGAGPRLAADGRYPLPCPVESGLSSTAFAAATVWPARTTILTAWSLVKKRIEALRGAHQPVVHRSRHLRDVKLDDRVRGTRLAARAQFRRETNGIEQPATDMRRRPAHQHDTAVAAPSALAGEIAMYERDRARRQLARGLLRIRVAAFLAHDIQGRAHRHPQRP